MKIAAAATAGLVAALAAGLATAQPTCQGLTVKSALPKSTRPGVTTYTLKVGGCVL
jgi:hypothetical protein